MANLRKSGEYNFKVAIISLKVENIVAFVANMKVETAINTPKVANKAKHE